MSENIWTKLSKFKLGEYVQIITNKAKIIALAKLAKNNDANAFSELIKLFESTLRRYCCNLTKCKVQGEDLYQETVLKAFLKIRHLNKLESFQYWIFRVAKNLYLNQLRGQNKVEFVQNESGVEAIEEKIDEVLLREIIVKVITSFDTKEVQILLLIYNEGYTSDEVAKKIGMSSSSVRANASEIRKKFIKRYNNILFQVGIEKMIELDLKEKNVIRNLDKKAA